jgi:hypothetical protein
LVIAQYSLEQQRNDGVALSLRERNIDDYAWRIQTLKDREQRLSSLRQTPERVRAVAQTRADIERFYGLMDAERRSYDEYRSGLGSRADVAVRPRSFNTGNIYGGYFLGRSEQQRLADEELLSRSRSTPGIYRLSTGQTVVSSLRDGDYGGFVVRSPVGTGVDGGRLYAPLPASESRVVSGIDLFDTGNRRAILENQSQFSTAGDIFKSAQNNPNNYGSPIATSSSGGYIYSSRSSALGVVDLDFLQKSGYVPQKTAREEAFQARLEGTKKREEQFAAFVTPITSSFGKGVQKAAVINEAFYNPIGVVRGKGITQSGFGKATIELTAQKAATIPFEFPIVASIRAGEKAAAFTESKLFFPKQSYVSANLPSFNPLKPEGASNIAVTALTLGGPIKSFATKKVTGVRQGSLSFVVDDFRTTPGSVVGSGRVTGTATVSTKQFGFFKKETVVPTEGSFLFSTSGRVRNTALADVSVVNSASFGGRTFWGDASWRGTFNVRGNRLTLFDSGGSQAFISQGRTGASVAPGVSRVSSQFAVFDRNQFGQFVVGSGGRSTGFGESLRYNKVGVSPSRVLGDSRVTNLLFSPEPSRSQLRQFAGLPVDRQSLTVVGGGASRVSPASFSVGSRRVESGVIGGANYRMVRAGFNDARVAGLYSDPSLVVPRSTQAASFVRPLLRSRRGEFLFSPSKQSVSGGTVFSPVGRSVSGRSVRPDLGGLPGPRFSIPSRRSSLLLLPQYGLSSARGVGGVLSPASARATSVGVSREPSFAVMPGFDTVVLPSQRATPRFDVTSQPRYDSIPRLDTIPRYDVIPPVLPVPGIGVPPPPFVPPPPMFPGVPGFGVGGGGGGGRGRRAMFGYAPSLGAVAFNVRGDTSQRRFSGFEVRPLAPVSGRRRSRRRRGS